MKTGTTNTYITARMATLLDAHGPQGDILRPLSAKLGYIVPAWDAAMRDEAERWRKKLEQHELNWLRGACDEALRSIDGGLPAADAVNAIQGVLARAGVGDWEMAQRIRGQVQRATVSARMALVWMLRDGVT